MLKRYVKSLGEELSLDVTLPPWKTCCNPY
jgi:hypothetical protein